MHTPSSTVSAAFEFPVCSSSPETTTTDDSPLSPSLTKVNNLYQQLNVCIIETCTYYYIAI